MNVSVALLSLFVSMNAFADASVKGLCVGNLKNGAHVEFEVRSTAVPTYLKADLAIGEDRHRVVSFNCKRSQENFGQINCVEKNPPGLKVLIENGTAQIWVETQGADQHLGTINCN